jgi:serine/threonine protein kinase
VWQRHATWAKVLVAAVGTLHDAKIVHADLKPANAYLIKDPTIASEYQLKLIDMDFSILADRKPPWQGYQGHVGTDNYRSPEHLTRGAVPILASDVFTLGLMLYELLAGRPSLLVRGPGRLCSAGAGVQGRAAGAGRRDAVAGRQCRGERGAAPLPVARSQGRPTAAGAARDPERA